MPHPVQMSLDSKQDKDTASCQSVILRHKEQKMESQYHFKYRPDYSKMVDNFKGVRDRIVRERRQKERCGGTLWGASVTNHYGWKAGILDKRQSIWVNYQQ